MKRTKQQQRRNAARQDRINRGLDLASHKRSPLHGQALNRHASQFMANARRRGWLLPKARQVRALAAG